MNDESDRVAGFSIGGSGLPRMSASLFLAMCSAVCLHQTVCSGAEAGADASGSGSARRDNQAERPREYTVVVDDWGPVVVDPALQFETSIAAVVPAGGGDMTLAGMWIDEGNEIGYPETWQLAMSLSDDGGRTWYAPGTDPQCLLPGDDPRRFLNGCYFVGCVFDNDDVVCDLLPDHCGFDWVEEPRGWVACDETVCAGGNGNLYFASCSNVPIDDLVNHTAWTVMFSRSEDQGLSWGPFGENGRRLKHICNATIWPGGGIIPDKVGVAASPDSGSDDVAVYWTLGHKTVYGVFSVDAGESFTAWDNGAVPTMLHDVSGGVNEQVSSPAGVIDGNGNLHLAWMYCDEFFEGYIQLRRWDPQRGWNPNRRFPPRTVQDLAEPFYSAVNHGPHAEVSAPSLAVDLSNVGNEPGPYYNDLYVVYSERMFQDHAHKGRRIRFAKSTNEGIDWSDPILISDLGQNDDSAQFYPRVCVDGCGNIGVSWYDTRNHVSGDIRQYDLYFAYSTDGGANWIEHRVSGQDPEPAYFDPNDGLPGHTPGHYSGMAADTRYGASEFYILAMGVPDQDRDDTDPSQNIRSYRVSLRDKE